MNFNKRLLLVLTIVKGITVMAIIFLLALRDTDEYIVAFMICWLALYFMENTIPPTQPPPPKPPPTKNSTQSDPYEF